MYDTSITEFGLGMFTAMKHRRQKLTTVVQDYVHHMDLKEDSDKSENEKTLVSILLDWLEVREEKSDKCTLLFDKMKPFFQKLVPAKENPAERSLISRIWAERDMFPKLSQWIAGGDGWAYDIGFG
jgi:pyruvate/2-oxoacid:ferredoxin oxidoreductase beta subunit